MAPLQDCVARRRLDGQLGNLKFLMSSWDLGKTVWSDQVQVAVAMMTLKLVRAT